LPFNFDVMENFRKKSWELFLKINLGKMGKKHFGNLTSQIILSKKI